MSAQQVLPILLLACYCCQASTICSNSILLAAQITVGRGTPPPAQSQGASQQNLPPDKKKNLPAIGPDEVFGGEREQSAPADPAKRPAPRLRGPAKTAGSPSPSPVVTASPASAQVTAPPPAPSPSPAAAERASANAIPTTAPVVTTAALTSSKPPSSVDWQFPALGLLTLFVFVALLYVLVKLRSLLREGNG